ncbi:MAG: patatin-like phospholipase family protein [Bacteroidetes Order II. Incertae sedis bacterium]|nr:patatin-like phospholipase family protein [Bacteroidetes Order II. bacterium]
MNVPNSAANGADTIDYSGLGLACAGGVVEGAIYEIGALNALQDAIVGLDLNQMSTYVGISSGALLTSCLANGVTVRALSKAVVGHAEEAELNFEPNTLFGFAIDEYIQRLSNIPKAVWKSVEYLFQHPTQWSLWGSLGGFGRVIPAGIFDNKNLEKYLRFVFSKVGRSNDFRKLKAKLRIVATDLDTAELVSFGETGFDEVPISVAVQASTALPGLYTPIKIGKKYYIDGVARRTVHASAALKEGVKLLFCINPIVPINTRSGEVQGEGKHLNDYGLPAVMSQTFRVLVFSRMQTGFERYKMFYPDADTILIEPRMDDDEVFFSNIFSFSNRHKVAEHAYQKTRTHLLEQAEIIQPKLAKHGLRLDIEGLKKPRSLYNEHDLNQGSSFFEEAQNTFEKLDMVLQSLRKTVGV